MSLLGKHNTIGNPDWDKKKIKKETTVLLEEIYVLVNKLYAEGQQSILLVLQGMDASGKDGLTRNLFQLVSPEWVNVHSFKKPTEEELAHHFLWRIQSKTPKKGMLSVFNRSHYEDILVPSVYGYVDDKTIEKRYEQINNFEKHLEENGTKIIKCYLHISKEKQGIKLQERIDVPEKNWKHSDGDWATRERWDEFMNVYENVFSKCNEIPWHIIPCDKNWTKLYSVANVLRKTLKEMNPQFPPLDSELFSK